MSSAAVCFHRLRISTPLGEMLALASDEGLCALEFPRSYAARKGPRYMSASCSAALSGPRSERLGPRSDGALHERLQRRLQRWFPPHDIVDRETPVLARTREWLSAYFDGTRADVPAAGDVPLDLRGAPFERRVWAALIEIPAGATASYGAIAAKLNAPGASRAVGAANGANPVSIIV